jgi:hypothetical protein
MTLTADERMWLEATHDELYAIGGKWAARFSYEELRAFQAQYSEMEERTGLTNEEWQAIDNRWWASTFAISIQQFGK